MSECYTHEDIRRRIFKLFKLGWSCDEHPLDGDDLTRTVTVLEAMVHELAHSRVMGAKHLQEPKLMWTTNKLCIRRPNPDWDEIKATAVTILVGDHYGFDLRGHALGNVGDNVDDRKEEAAGMAEAALDLKNVQVMARSVVKYIEKAVVG